jgi:hypothetical protein
MTTSAYAGVGKIHVALFSDSATFEGRKFRSLENSSAFEFSFTQEEKTLADFTNASGGIDASFKRITGGSGKMDLRRIGAENLALALFGTTSVLNTTPIVGESGYKIVPGMFLPTKRLIDQTVAPVVKKGGTTILTADYSVSAGGITIASTITTGGVASGDSVTIDYTPVASSDVQALLTTSPEVSIIFDGINSVNGKALVVKIFKAQLGALSSLSLISDDFITLSLPFSVVKDSSISAAGKSQYVQIEQQT